MISNKNNNFYLNYLEKLNKKEIKVGIIGMGYVGLPLALSFCEKDIKVIAFEINRNIVKSLNLGKSHIKHINSEEIQKFLHNKQLHATDDFLKIKELDAIIICVPTPLNEEKEPDLSHIIKTINNIKPYLVKGQLLSLESTTYPGTTNDILKPLIESVNFNIGEDFFLLYSPEREDPCNKSYKSYEIPKVIGGITKNCADIGEKFYGLINEKVIKVSSTKSAEMTKLLENIYRAVNIGLINELKILTDKLDLDIYEIINAAATKPFGFKAFYPGPGVGGHCIPIDPIYLSWKAKKEFNLPIKFIELAEKVNSEMPKYVIDKIIKGINDINLKINKSKILVLGISYKKNIDDCRESPSIEIINGLIKLGASVSYNDPFFQDLKLVDRINSDQKSLEICKNNLELNDCVVLLTDHDVYDYEFIYEYGKLIIDTKGKFKISKKVIRA